LTFTPGLTKNNSHLLHSAVTVVVVVVVVVELEMSII